MDRTFIRETLLTKFKPKSEDIATPYLVTPDGTSLDGQLRLVGMTGQEGLDLNKSCTVNGVVNEGKFTGMLIVKCLRMRDETSTPVFDATDGENLLSEFDLDIVNKLGVDIQHFLGLTPAPLVTPKSSSEPTPPPSITIDSPGTSVTPVSDPSLSVSEPTISPDGQPI